MTATATTDEQEILVNQPESATLFASRREDLRLIKYPRYPQFGAGGQKVGEARGEALQFRHGALPVPATGTITLEDGREVDAGEVREWLRGHRRFGDQHEGFWEVTLAAPPVSDEEQRRVMRAVARLGSETLETMLEQERAGWAREGFIETLEESLTEVRELRAEAEKIAAEEAERARQAEAEAADAAKKQAAAEKKAAAEAAKAPGTPE